MKYILLVVLLIGTVVPASAQTRKMVAIGSSTTEGLNAIPAMDSSWVRRFNYYYKYQLGVLDSTYNLGVSGTTPYNAMPSSYTPPAGRPSPDVNKNVTRANVLTSDLATPANGVVIINFPTNGYDVFTIAEIMTSLQIMYDSVVVTGKKCYVTTTQPRTDGVFAPSAIKRKLAVIKDSILIRFGQWAINFYDGMYDPADSSIAAPYRSFDLTHFNNAGHRELFSRVVAKNVFNLAYTPVTGDYRSNVNPTGTWDVATNWETFNGTSWVTAGAAPNASSGVITILNGDSMRVNNATTMDQVVVENGGILIMFNGSTATTFTLNDGVGPDITNNGKLYVSANGTLSGAGTVQNNSGGLFTIRNLGVLSANATNALGGTVNTTGTGIIQSSAFYNYGLFNLIEFTLNLNNATFNNYGTINFSSGANSFIAITTGTGTLINHASGTFIKSNSAGVAQTSSSIAFTNNGVVKGIGEFTFSNVVANNGTISPGTSPGVLTVNPGFITGKTPVIDLEINSTGAVAGTHYTRLLFSTVSSLNTNVSGATLRVTDLAADPVGTTYTFVTTVSGSSTITGPFANVVLSPTLGNLSISGNTVTVQKMAPLPLVWGSFTALVNRQQQVVLNWKTLQETNVQDFVVEHSTNGQQYHVLSRIRAAGNSNTGTSYAYTHTQPSLAGNNFYRLRQVDVDGKTTNSPVRTVRFNNGKPYEVQLTPNPVQQVLYANIQAEGIRVDIQQNGRRLRGLQLAPGQHNIFVGDLPAGIYQLVIYRHSKRVESRQMIRQ